MDIPENWNGIFETCALDVLKQRKRLGGNFAISGAAILRSHRDAIRSVIKEDLIIINLKLKDKDHYKERLINRHGDKYFQGLIDWLIGVGDVADEISEDEENTFEITADKDMSREDVVAKVLEILSK